MHHTKKKFALILCFLLAAANCLAQTATKDPATAIMERINEVLCALFTLVLYVSAALTALMIILAGVKYMTADDPRETDNAKKRIVYAFTGLVIVLVACPVVDYLVTNTNITPFSKSCNCFGVGGGPGGGGTTTTTPHGSTTTSGGAPTTGEPGATTTTSTTSTTSTAVDYLTAENLVEGCIKQVGGILQTADVGCLHCAEIEYIFNETKTAPVGPAKSYYAALNKKKSVTGSPCGAIPCWSYGTKHEAGCKTFRELNEFYGCGLTPVPGYQYVCCDGTKSTSC
ncbi:MAG: TrbC/VirB2 family protein [Candidatus Altiarchaeota archaeon]|nr:TrbC/VirB2 family protein [Candidatus Altiarchaeota archaeon]